MYNIGCGDVRAMKHLMDNYLDLVSRTSFRILCDRKDSEAVTVDVFLHAWNYAEKYDGSMPLSYWLLRLASRYARLRIARRRILYFFGRRPDLFVTAAPKASDYDDYVTKQAWELFCRTSIKMSPLQRTLFTLCVLEELPVDDVVNIVNVPKVYVNYLLSKAETRFRKKLRSLGSQDKYPDYVGFLRKVAEGFTEHDKLKRMIMTSIR